MKGVLPFIQTQQSKQTQQEQIIKQFEKSFHRLLLKIAIYQQKSLLQDITPLDYKRKVEQWFEIQTIEREKLKSTLQFHHSLMQVLQKMELQYGIIGDVIEKGLKLTLYETIHYSKRKFELKETLEYLQYKLLQEHSQQSPSSSEEENEQIE